MRELELIRKITKSAAAGHPDLKQGIGDDCAVFHSPKGEELLVTADMLVENVHFDTRWHAPFLLGRKAVAVNISDIAAMAGFPKFALLSIGLSSKYSSDWVDAFTKGILSQLADHNCILVGGDTVQSPNLTISVTVIGSVGEGQGILRNTAGIGDKIFCSGPLGLAAAGLYICQHEKYDISDTRTCGRQQLMRCHLDPLPKVAYANHLAATGGVTAMQDISDGIATDLSHICTASGVSARVWAEKLPGHQELYDLCREKGLDPVDFQLRGGEDYELLFTVKAGMANKVRQQIVDATGAEPHEIGEIEEGRGVVLEAADGSSRSIEYQGYEHTSP